MGVPLVALVGVDLIGRRERTRYFTGLMAVVAFACFILDTSVINGIFNRVFAPWEMLAWAALALLLAYHYRLLLLLVAGIVLLMAYVAAQATALTGVSWGMFMARPETICTRRRPGARRRGTSPASGPEDLCRSRGGRWARWLSCSPSCLSPSAAS